VVAAIVQAGGFEALTARDTGLLGRADSEQWEFVAEAGRILLTHNQLASNASMEAELKVGGSIGVSLLRDGAQPLAWL